MGGRSSENVEKPTRKHRKGLWSPEEDQRLRSYVLKHGHGCWSSIPVHAGLQRNGKSCRLRWINYLRPGLKRGTFTAQEEETILKLHSSLGNKWSQIALQLPGRTDNEVKNHWHSYLKKRVTRAEDIRLQAQTDLGDPGHSSLSGERSVHCQTPVSDHTLQECRQKSPVGLPGGQSSLPKIFFTEWLSLDNNARGGTTADQSDTIGSIDALSYNWNVDDCNFDNLLPSEMTVCGGYNSSEPSEASASEMIHSLQFDMCSDDFTLNDDLIFM